MDTKNFRISEGLKKIIVGAKFQNNFQFTNTVPANGPRLHENE